MSILFENTRRTLVTLLRADHLEFDPPPRVLARRAFGRRIERVVLHATGVPIEHTDVKIGQLDVEALDVQLGMNRRGPTVRIGSATFAARLTQEQLSALIPLPPGIDRLTITRRGITFHTFAGIPIYTTVVLEERRLVVRPSAPAKVPFLDLIGIDIDLPHLPVAGGALEQLSRFGLAFDLPQLPANAVIDHLEPQDGELYIAGSLDLTPHGADV